MAVGLSMALILNSLIGTIRVSYSKMLKKILLALFCIIQISYAENIRADVQAVKVTGDEGRYHFSVKLKSTETGCAQYANWWEVLSHKGELLYRRILVHSHPDTQPFTRSGGSVDISKDDVVYVRAHMNTHGYIGDVFVGSVTTGFKISDSNTTFANDLETQKPLPTGCLY